MSNDQLIELLLLKIKSLIASKEMETATANKELHSGGWLSDHQQVINQIDAEIESLERQVYHI